jgi:hypothetical protein
MPSGGYVSSNFGSVTTSRGDPQQVMLLLRRAEGGGDGST